MTKQLGVLYLFRTMASLGKSLTVGDNSQRQKKAKEKEEEKSQQ